MKASRYNLITQIDENKKILYNTLTRKYIVYDKDLQQYMDKLLENSYQKKYTRTEALCLQDMVKKGMIIEDNFDELSFIEFEENRARFQDQGFRLTIQPTLDCNFRCTYCYEDHRKINMNDETSEKLVKFVDKTTQSVKNLHVIWFGGEPLLEIERIKSLTARFKEICEKNGCDFAATIVTNGYLFDDNIIESLGGLCIKKVQITLDGCGEVHDKKRPLTDGQGTYEKVIENIIKLSQKDININLRINVDEENYSQIDGLLNIICDENKNKINVGVANLFQKKEKLNMYDFYRKAIEKGYNHFDKTNQGFACDVCLKNGLTIDPAGRVVPCSVGAEQGFCFGCLTEAGEFKIQDRAFYYKLKTVSALKNEACRKCIQLPMCMGKCKISRYKDNSVCNAGIPDGMKPEERALLHYYSDLMQNITNESEVLHI